MKRITFFTFILILTSSASADEIEFNIATHYSHAIRFGKNRIPMISIRVSNHHNSYNINSRSGLLVEYMQDGRIRRIKTKEATIFSRGYSKGDVIYKLIVDRVNFNDEGIKDQVIQQFKDLGYEVESILIGSLFGLKGRVYDNRQYYISIATFSRKEEADTLLTKLFNKYRIRGFLLPVLKRYPSGKIGIFIKDRKLDLVANDIVWVRGNGGGLTLSNSTKKINIGTFGGDIYFTFEPNGQLDAINRIDLEELLRGILPSEIYASAHIEALKAQAIAARTEILSAIGHRHPATPFLLCATQHCQVYNGTTNYTRETDRAVRETAGVVLLYEKRFVRAVYSSNCGGHTEDNSTVWGEHPEPYLRPVVDADPSSDIYKKFRDGITEENLEEFIYAGGDTFCSSSSFSNKKAFRWKEEIPYNNILLLLKKRFDINGLDDIIIEGRGISGRIKGITIISGEKKFYIDREYNIRQLFGGLKSGLMIIEKKKDSSGRIVSLIFTGAGWGHGVGMCQTGAIGMAERGYHYSDILKHYYSGVRIEKVY